MAPGSANRKETDNEVHDLDVRLAGTVTGDGRAAIRRARMDKRGLGSAGDVYASVQPGVVGLRGVG